MELPEPPYTLTFDPDGELVLRQPGDVQTKGGRPWVRLWMGTKHVSRWLDHEQKD